MRSLELLRKVTQRVGLAVSTRLEGLAWSSLLKQPSFAIKATGRWGNCHEVPTLLHRDLAICYRIVSGQPCTGSRLSRHNHTGRRLRVLSSRHTVRGCHPPITTTFAGWTNPCK